MLPFAITANSEDDLRKSFDRMQLELLAMSKTIIGLQQSFETFKVATSKPVTQINEMEKSLEGMNTAIKMFEKSKDEFGEKLVRDVKDLRSDVDRLTIQQREDTNSITSIKKKQLVQEEQIKFLFQQMKLQNNLFENRFKILEEDKKNNIPKRALQKRWSLPLSYLSSTAAPADSDQQRKNHTPSSTETAGTLVRRRSSRRNRGSFRSSLSKKKLYSSTQDLRSTDANEPPVKDNALYTLPQGRNRRLHSSDSSHTKKLFSTSTPADSTHGQQREESGYFGSPPPHFSLGMQSDEHSPIKRDSKLKSIIRISGK